MLAYATVLGLVSVLGRSRRTPTLLVSEHALRIGECHELLCLLLTHASMVAQIAGEVNPCRKAYLLPTLTPLRGYGPRRAERLLSVSVDGRGTVVVGGLAGERIKLGLITVGNGRKHVQRLVVV